MAGKLTDHYHDVGPGWAALLTMLHAELQEFCPDYIVNQVKEKFGGLRAYLAPPRDEGINPAQVAAANRAHALEIHYEALSLHVCETCGKSGTNEANSRGWYKTLCQEHRTALT